MKLSIIIPARDEEKNIQTTILNIIKELDGSSVDYEILVVNDGSKDLTVQAVEKLTETHKKLRLLQNVHPNGFGLAVRKGLEHYQGDAVIVVMGDGSDHPEDIVKYYRKLEEGYECVFGSRFIKGSILTGYPTHKLILNRMANYFIKFLFGLKHNDITNAFKCYRREVIEGIQPLFSNHFNLTVEMPLKAVVRGYSYVTVPIRWANRTTGFSKLKIKEMGSRYLFIVLYLFLEKALSCGDYSRKK